jgi:hypothetical protein
MASGWLRDGRNPVSSFKVQTLRLFLRSDPCLTPATKSSSRRNPLEVFEDHAGFVENNVSMKPSLTPFISPCENGQSVSNSRQSLEQMPGNVATNHGCIINHNTDDNQPQSSASAFNPQPFPFRFQLFAFSVSAFRWSHPQPSTPQPSTFFVPSTPAITPQPLRSGLTSAPRRRRPHALSVESEN